MEGFLFNSQWQNKNGIVQQEVPIEQNAQTVNSSLVTLTP